MLNILCALLPLMFWDFSIPHSRMAFTLIIFNGFIQGMLWTVRKDLKAVLKKDAERMQKEIEKL